VDGTIDLYRYINPPPIKITKIKRVRFETICVIDFRKVCTVLNFKKDQLKLEFEDDLSVYNLIKD
jgi:hypothetical protein